MKKIFITLTMVILMTASTYGATLQLTAPNGGESWPLGKTRLITWSSNNVIGTVRLDLSSYTPEMKSSSNGAFTIAKETSKAGSAITPLKSLSLTYPRRGDRWHKGSGYTIKWTSAGLQNSKIKLQLLALDGQTVVMTIKENIDNNGQTFWTVPMSLPDAETLYKMRIQTMDNAFSDTVGPFPIAKGTPAAGPPAIKVTAPGGPGQISTGITIPIRWTSTCGTSANGPTDDGFIIDLMNATGSTKIRNLLDSKPGVYDNEWPTGVHNWHWDWPIAMNEGAGKYRIRVNNLSGHCVGMSEQFELAYRQEYKEYTVTPVPKNCVYMGPWAPPGVIRPLDDLARLQGIPGLARVGFYFRDFTLVSDGRHVYENIILRSKLSMGDKEWYKDKGHVLSAKMIIERKWQMPADQDPTAPCLGGVVVLSQDASCGESPNLYAPPGSNPPSMPGTSVPINASAGHVWEVDLTQAYQKLVSEGRPDYGLMLYPAYGSTTGGRQFIINAECYKVTLTFRFAKDIK
jgi:hypothetical protein